MIVNIELLRQQIRIFESGSRPQHPVFSLGISEIDDKLPDGGLKLGAVHEIIAHSKSTAAGFCAIIAGKLAHNRGPILWCLPQANVCPQGLRAFGLNSQEVFFAPFSTLKEGLWAVEEGLKTEGLSAVIAEGLTFSIAASRRLHLSAQKSGVSAFLIMPEGKKCTTNNVAATRWRISTSESTTAPSFLSYQGIGNIRFLVELLRVKGGVAPYSWLVEWDEQALCLHLAQDRISEGIGQNRSAV